MDKKSCMEDKAKSRRWGRRAKIWAGLIGLLCLGLLAAPYGMRWLLIVDVPQGPAEILLLDQTGQSLRTGVELYQQGTIQGFLIPDGVPESYRGVEAPIYKQYRIQEALRAAGIPVTAITSFEAHPRSRLERQVALRHWIREHGVCSYMIFTDPLSTRYERMLHRQTFPEEIGRASCRERV